MSAEELAGLVCATLRNADITVTLTGGGCVAIWSEGKYVSRDLDFIEEGPVPRRQIKVALQTLGFTERNRYFCHPETDYFIEFPSGPLMVGDARVDNVASRETGVGLLRLLTPTDCMKDRLAAYFHWNDKQALEQALMVSLAQPVDLDDISRWSDAEGAAAKFRTFKAALAAKAAPTI
jgi:hypothetical protein